MFLWLDLRRGLLKELAQRFLLQVQCCGFLIFTLHRASWLRCWLVQRRSKLLSVSAWDVQSFLD
jgi:hypothetical protein